MAVCLLPDKVQEFRDALKNKALDIRDLLTMSTEERTALLEKYAGKENAADVNKLFEQKLVLKNQLQGLKNWASKLGEVGRYSPDRVAEAQKAIADWRSAQQERIMSPAETETFLNSLADKVIGTHISRDVAAKVFELSNAAEEAKTKVTEDMPDGSPERLAYGAAKVAADNYVSGIIKDADKLTLDDLKQKPFATTLEAATKVASAAKELKSTGDISSILRQGLKIVFSHPTVWLKDAAGAFADTVKQGMVKGTDVHVRDALQADLASRRYAMDGTYKAMGLDTNVDEELYPSQTAEKIPIFGRVTAATRAGYEGFLHRARADLADMYLDMAKSSGLDITDPDEIKPIGRMVNSMTGRGYTGSVSSTALNAAFWSPRMIKSDFDFLTAQSFQGAFDKGVRPSSFVRKQAAYNLVRTIAGVAGVLALAKAVNPNSVTFDSRSTKFGKITVGGISYDVTGGSNTLIVLASRLIQNSEVTSTGKVEKLNTGKFGAPKSSDIIWEFMSGKASPVASVALDIANRSGFGGTPLSPETEAVNAFAPFPIQNLMSATPQVGLPDAVAGEILDSLGVYETIPTTPVKK